MTAARVSVAALVLAAFSGLACAVSASASSSSGQPPAGQGPAGTHGTGKPALQTGGDPASNPGGGTGGAAPVATGPAAPACVPVLSDLYTSLFSGRVLMRLPKGVELPELKLGKEADEEMPAPNTEAGGAEPNNT